MKKALPENLRGPVAALLSSLNQESKRSDQRTEAFRALRDRYAKYAQTHPLRREIITTAVVNDVVNHGGISFVYRAMEETGAGIARRVSAS